MVFQFVREFQDIVNGAAAAAPLASSSEEQPGKTISAALYSRVTLAGWHENVHSQAFLWIHAMGPGPTVTDNWQLTGESEHLDLFAAQLRKDDRGVSGKSLVRP